MRLSVHAFKIALVAALCLGAPAPHAQYSDLPELGDESSSVLPPSEERKLGEDFLRRARTKLRFTDDPEVNTYVQRLGERLAAGSDSSVYRFRFFVILDPSINAFAVPGGYIGVHSGLILASNNESELASVLAHEITHVTQRHIPRMLTAAQHRTLPTMAAVIAGVLLGGEVGQAAIAATSAYNIEQQLSFTRDFEREADRLGMQLLARSEFDPGGMPAFFQQLLRANSVYDTGLPDFLRTHPVTTERIAESWARADVVGRREHRDSEDYQRVRAKLRVLSTERPGDVATLFKERLGTDAAMPADRYGYAHAMLALGRHDAAREALKPLLAADPDEVAYRVLAAQIEADAGRHARAVEMLRAADAASPEDPVVTRYLGEVLVESGNAAEARDVLSTAVRRDPDDPALQHLLARAAGEAGDRVQAHRALAEYHYLTGDARAAVRELQRASRLAQGNFYVQASVDARIREIESEYDLDRRASDQDRR
jgi:predicted Zn-dependent protease